MSEVVQEAPAAAPQAPGVIDLMKEALALYRQHARVLLLTAAALFVPGSFLSSCALSVTLGPLLRDWSSYEEATQRAAARSEAMSRRIEEQAAHGSVDSNKVLLELAREQKRGWEELGHVGAGGAASRLKKVMSGVLGVVGWVTLFLILNCVLVPLTQGALTIAVLDRLQGGNASWIQIWRLLLRHHRRLLSALVPAAALGLLGYLLLLLPGLLLSCFFSFVALVVLLEGLGGQDAIKRSYALVRSDWVRVALSLLSFAAVNWVAHGLAALVLPTSALYWSLFLGDLVRLALMPIPITLSTLLYLDIRRLHDGWSRPQLEEKLTALRLAN